MTVTMNHDCFTDRAPVGLTSVILRTACDNPSPCA
jgi:hypothetical protein